MWTVFAFLDLQTDQTCPDVYFNRAHMLKRGVELVQAVGCYTVFIMTPNSCSYI